MAKRISYTGAMGIDNRALRAAGMPYRYGADGIALCATCGQTYFRADRRGTKQPDCDHYDGFHEVEPPLIPAAEVRRFNNRHED